MKITYLGIDCAEKNDKYLQISNLINDLKEETHFSLNLLHLRDELMYYNVFLSVEIRKKLFLYQILYLHFCIKLNYGIFLSTV